jgi:hypothetical protein
MSQAKKDFSRSILVERIVTKFAGEFTPAEWAAHKKEHPGADVSDHTITKPESGEKKPEAESKGEGKPKSGEPKSEDKGEPKSESKPQGKLIHPTTADSLMRHYTQKTRDLDLSSWTGGRKRNPVVSLLNKTTKKQPVTHAEVLDAIDFVRDQRKGEGRESARKELDHVKMRLKQLAEQLK